MNQKLKEIKKAFVVLLGLTASYIILWLILFFLLFGCTTPAITTYQQGTCIGDRVEIRETLNLNERVWYVDCKCDSGEKVIIKIVRK